MDASIVLRIPDLCKFHRNLCQNGRQDNQAMALATGGTLLR